MTYKERYKRLSPVKRAMFRQFMSQNGVKEPTWRKWFDRDNIPDLKRKRQVSIMLRKLSTLKDM